MYLSCFESLIDIQQSSNRNPRILGHFAVINVFAAAEALSSDKSTSQSCSGRTAHAKF